MFSSVGSLALLVMKASTMLALSAVIVAAMIRLLRFSSPRVERMGWFCVLVQGILLVHLPLSIPWYVASVSEPNTPPQAPAVAVDAPPPAPGPEMQEEPQDSSPPAVTANTTQPLRPVTVSKTTWSKANLFLCIWLVGIAGLIGCEFYRYARFVRQLCTSNRGNDLWRQEWQELLAEADIRQPIPLVVTRQAGPALCLLPSGYCVLVPEEAWAKLRPGERRAVLRHELAHYQHGDLWKSLVARLLAVVHWFNPLAWWALGRFETCGEWLCDQLAAEAAGAAAYARALMQLGGAGLQPVPQGNCGYGGRLFLRVRRILTSQPAEDTAMKKLILVGAVAGLVVLGVVRFELVAVSVPAQAGDTGPTKEVVAVTKANPDATVTITVSGKITDARTKQPIAGALVRGCLPLRAKNRGPEGMARMPYQETRSDAHGDYVLRLATPLTAAELGAVESLCMGAGADGYEARPQWSSPIVSPEKTTITGVDIALRVGKRVCGRVVDEDGKPVPNASVRIQNNSSNIWTNFNFLGSGQTGSDGKFALWCSTDTSEVIGRAPWLRIDKEGYGTGFFWDLLKKGDLGTLVLPRGGTITGRVVDSQGKPVPGCEVSAHDLWPNRLAVTKTDEQGRYTLTGVPGEQVLSEFFQRRNGQANLNLVKVTVYARANPAANLADMPRYAILAKDGETVAGPDLVIGRELSISGKLMPSKNGISLKGLLVRLDYDWDTMVEADAEGNFRFPNVAPGWHRLTAYLATNTRGDAGIGRTGVAVKAGQPLAGVAIPLDTLAEVRVQFVDSQGNPLEGITVGATASKNGDGFWTEGTRSGKDGRATLYLTPSWGVQYVRGFDQAHKLLVSEGYHEIRPATRPLADNVKIVMVPTATVRGQLVLEGAQPSEPRQVRLRLEYADGLLLARSLDVNAQGKYELGRLPPGTVKLSWLAQPAGLQAVHPEPLELKSGVVAELPAVTLRAK
jgi:beta-lactamase regulating signal transducer with metallopeptidase domain/uncharacterized GH25 family protein